MFTVENLNAAHKHCSANDAEVKKSEVVVCIFCAAKAGPETLSEFVEKRGKFAGQVTVFHNCGVDAVIGSASGFPVENPEFVRAMHDHFFAGL